MEDIVLDGVSLGVVGDRATVAIGCFHEARQKAGASAAATFHRAVGLLNELSAELGDIGCPQNMVGIDRDGVRDRLRVQLEESMPANVDVRIGSLRAGQIADALFDLRCALDELRANIPATTPALQLPSELAFDRASAELGKLVYDWDSPAMPTDTGPKETVTHAGLLALCETLSGRINQAPASVEPQEIRELYAAMYRLPGDNKRPPTPTWLTEQPSPLNSVMVFGPPGISDSNHGLFAMNLQHARESVEAVRRWCIDRVAEQNPGASLNAVLAADTLPQQTVDVATLEKVLADDREQRGKELGELSRAINVLAESGATHRSDNGSQGTNTGPIVHADSTDGGKSATPADATSATTNQRTVTIGNGDDSLVLSSEGVQDHCIPTDQSELFKLFAAKVAMGAGGECVPLKDLNCCAGSSDTKSSEVASDPLRKSISRLNADLREWLQLSSDTKPIGGRRGKGYFLGSDIEWNIDDSEFKQVLTRYSQSVWGASVDPKKMERHTSTEPQNSGHVIHKSLGGDGA
ncbi:MAG: hypothetical protein HOL01_07590 [Planctomycetaceae bacterium]|nr:hypothetical protein [Planctomycetaceae bacterium]MBT6485541.1 hypothetical protein [Planctomycetaceae bacterium]MBT6494399.1 hypothetical protein [Planctomycetaceae bacterium]